MAERELEPEVNEILGLIQEGKHFLLSGGAGSGKTYSLVHVIKEVLATNPSATVACMTYTNAAVKEISRRRFARLDRNMSPLLFMRTLNDAGCGIDVFQFDLCLHRNLVCSCLRVISWFQILSFLKIKT